MYVYTNDSRLAPVQEMRSECVLYVIVYIHIDTLTFDQISIPNSSRHLAHFCTGDDIRTCSMSQYIYIYSHI